MGATSINFAEKRLLDHLKMGGSCTDEVGLQLTMKFATKVWTDSTTAEMFRQYGMTIEELAYVYAGVISALMPEPWMNVSGPMLVPTQWFMEPHRFENLLVEVARETGTVEREEWLQALTEKAVDLAVDTRHMHDEAYGKPNITIQAKGGLPSARGCAGALLLLLLPATLL